MPQIVVRVLCDRQEQPRGSVDDVEMIKADAGEFSESDSEDREINAGDAEAKGKKADHCAAGRRNWDGSEKAQPGRKPEPGKQSRRNVSTEADIERVTERQLSGKAHHDVPGLAGKSEIENDDKNGDEIIVDDPRRGNERRQKRDGQDHGSARHAADKRPDRGAHHAAFRPSRPCGRNSRTSTRMPKANMLLADGVNSSPANASVSPIKRPP